jgi:ABC-type nitrate/sulfonate/bicarbonate transport system ATPase subunit
MRKPFSSRPEETRPRLITDFFLEVRPGEVLTIVGESAAGKTTLLRILSALERRFRGSVALGGEPIVRPDRRIYLMPQAHTLLPWLSVEGNLLFFACHNSGQDAAGAVDGFLERLELTNRRETYPKTLSGGERARVALACAMIAAPDVLLLDEPFRSLDQVTSERCQRYLLEWLDYTARKEIVVIVSHSVSDAVFLGDRLIVVRREPLSVYREFNIPIPRPRRRRSAELLKYEDSVLDALNETAAQQQHAADGAARRR